MTVTAINQLVNLEAYPIADPESPARQALVKEMGRIYARWCLSDAGFPDRCGC